LKARGEGRRPHWSASRWLGTRPQPAGLYLGWLAKTPLTAFQVEEFQPSLLKEFPANGERALKAHYQMLSLDGLGAFSRAELSAAGALIAYLELTQKGRKVALARIARVSPAHFMGIDAATRRNLELTQTLSGQRSGSLERRAAAQKMLRWGGGTARHIGHG